jgi:hypothetical protein
MISTEMKIKKSKQAIKYIIFASAIYLVICITTILDALVITSNEDVAVFSEAMIVLYLLGISSASILTFNIIRFHNVDMIRKKAIHDYDERNALVQEKTNTFTLLFVCFSLVIGLLLSIHLNSVELFTACLILLFLIILAHVIIKILVKRKL